MDAWMESGIQSRWSSVKVILCHCYRISFPAIILIFICKKELLDLFGKGVFAPRCKTEKDECTLDISNPH